MFTFKTLAALAAALFMPLVAQAHDGLHLHDPFARVTPQSGAVYVFIHNDAGTDDRLLAARSEAAGMVMPMTMQDKGDGTMVMVNAPEGFPIPAGSDLVLAPGGLHLMLMGLKQKLKDGDTFTLTLSFANSGDVTLTVPVMSARKSAPTGADTGFDAETGNATPAPDAAAPAP